MGKPEEVVLRREVCRWNKLPQQLRFRLVNGTVSVRELRGEIARSAKVSTMPPVHVFPEVWVTPDKDGAIHATATVLKMGGENLFGVRLAAPTVLFDRRTLRRILVHEFAHSFHHMQATVDAIDDGRTSISWRTSDVFEDEEFERGQLIDPQDWFGETDAKDFMNWDDEALQGNEKLVVKLADHLPLLTPDLNFQADGISIYPSVVEHIRRIRSGRPPE